MPVKIDGINIHNDSKNVALVKKLGCKWVRMDVNWWTIEKAKGSYSWSSIDATVNAYKSAGISIYATLMGTPSWLGENFTIPPEVSAWKNFCRTFAKRYVGKVDVISLWNEPNLGKTFWSGTMDKFFEIIVKEGSQAIKEVNPNILVASPDLATTGNSHWTSWFSKMKKYQKCIDIFAFHTYQSSASKVCRCWNSGKFWFLGWMIPKWRPYRWYLKKIHCPIYLTEIGYPAEFGNVKKMELQRKFVEDLTKRKKDLKGVDQIFFYCLLDASPKNEEPFGFYSKNGFAKTVSI